MDTIWLLQIIVRVPKGLLTDDTFPFSSKEKALEQLPKIAASNGGTTILGMPIEGFWLFCHQVDDPYELDDEQDVLIFNSDGSLRNELKS